MNINKKLLLSFSLSSIISVVLALVILKPTISLQLALQLISTAAISVFIGLKLLILLKKITQKWQKDTINRLHAQQLLQLPKINLKKKQVEGISVQEIISAHKTPLYIVSKQHLIQKFSKTMSELKKNYSNLELAYSYKTNSLLEICRTFNQQGALAEVVAESEYYLAQKIGVKPSKIIVNGPTKNVNFLKKALSKGSMINADNLDEVRNIAAIADSLSKSRFSIGIRINTPNIKHRSRFGFNINEKITHQAIKIIQDHPKLQLVGIHTHLKTNINSLREYSQSVQAVISFSEKIQTQHKLSLKYLNFGGGFPTLASNAVYPNKLTPTADELFNTAITAVKESQLNGIKIYFEPGRYLIDESMMFLSKVLHSTNQNSQQKVVLDSTSYQVPLTRYQPPLIKTFNQHSSKQKYLTTFFGSSCVEGDILAKDELMPLLKPNDLVIFYNIGAYNLNQSAAFIFAQPSVMVVDNQKFYLARRSKSNQDLWRLDKK